MKKQSIKKQMYLCVDLKVRMQERGMSVGEGRKGMLMMTVDGERFEFDEALPESCRRNPKVWCGDVLNVHQNRRGELVVNFRRIVMDENLNLQTLSRKISAELKRAKQDLLK